MSSRDFGLQVLFLPGPPQLAPRPALAFLTMLFICGPTIRIAALGCLGIAKTRGDGSRPGPDQRRRLLGG